MAAVVLVPEVRALKAELPPPPIVAHPVAFPFARIPVGAFPVEQRVGADASAEAVAAFPVVLWLRVGKLSIFAAESAGALFHASLTVVVPLPVEVRTPALLAVFPANLVGLPPDPPRIRSY
jgi:hypothetical protein